MYFNNKLNIYIITILYYLCIRTYSGIFINERICLLKSQDLYILLYCILELVNH